MSRSNLAPITFAAFIVFAAVYSIGCQRAIDLQTGSVSGDWLIPRNQVYDGGPRKDGIPALSNPSFVPAKEASYLSDEELVIGVKIGSEVRAYPHPILDWHEIINDEINGKTLAITYCPLTGSGIGWNRVLNGQTTTFGVSGLLYNTNLISYDRATNSNWSQMKLQCVNGPLKGTFIETSRVLETTWKTWKEMYPDMKVVSANTGYSRPYGRYPYGDYTTSNDLLFPIANDDRRLPRKERVHGIIIGDQARVYRIISFPDTVGTVNDSISGVPIVVVGSRLRNFLMSYERTLPNRKVLIFSPVQNSLPAAMIDNEGTTWDVWGRGLSGPRAGAKLKPTRSFIAYWFAWGAFYPGAEIYSK